MRTFYGKSGIKVTILADSINAAGNRFTTYEIEYPRLILAELNTHRDKSRNSFSSRAVPFEKMLKQLDGIPVRFGANQAGMQDKGEDFDAGVLGWPVEYDGNTGAPLWDNKGAWNEAKEHAIFFAEAFKDAGYHKQVYNRLLEPFQMMKTVISGTEWDNFFWLRNDDAADPTLHELARVMQEARDASVPTLLKAGDWHLPYLDYYNEQIGYEDDGDTPIYGPQVFYIGDLMGEDFQILTLEQAIKISCARCAAVSYRNEGYGLEKSLEVYDNLVGGDRKHASAFEHCGTPIAPTPPIETAEGILVTGKNINVPFWPETWEDGVSHMTKDGRLWSGNLCGWIQYRKLIKGECYGLEIT